MTFIRLARKWRPHSCVRLFLPRESACLDVLALVLSLCSTSLHTPGVNARLSNRANARSSVRMITLVDEVDEKAMLVRRASHA